MPFRRSTADVTLSISNLFFDKLQKNKSQIEQKATDYAKAEYNSPAFTKAPVDSGESKASTTAVLEVINGLKSANLQYKIDTPQATFFRYGLGTNRKYGQRDPMKESWRNQMSNELIKILQ